MSIKYKIVFLVRFFGYLLFYMGLFGIVFIFGPFLQVELGYRIDKGTGVKRTVADVIPATEGFDEIQTSEDLIVPVSTEFGIVIEKINANAKIIPEVNPADEKQYTKALAEGVAEALGSTPPGQPGNLYLFSHSTDAPWNIVRYNAIFYLLRELDVGDRVVIFYKKKRYNYIVFDKIVTDASDVSYLTKIYNTPVLTLQTCDPPGTLLKRLVIRARSVSS